ncbi:MAG: 3-phosphoshikimate 1-carboxyvinyltransferase [Saprospiraceae bacterium]|nr:3-phosphoshikimate 1-carboxyvinyltransferase [Saprospiraceae bacterium]
MKIVCNRKVLLGEVDLVRSKSIANRLLIIQALADFSFGIKNNSNAEDTQTLTAILNSLREKSRDAEDYVLDVGPAGTCFRFLTAYLTIQKGTFVLTGSERMKQRPIGPLVDALRSIDADIHYLEKEGYPPLKIKGRELSSDAKIVIDASISSQFISALIMLAPCLNGGLSITLEGKISSRPYLEMTLTLMRKFGIDASFEDNEIRIQNGTYTGMDLEVEADWSGASYFYGLVALAAESNLLLKGLQLDSIQGDSKIADLFREIGVDSIQEDTGVRIRSKGYQPNGIWSINFSEIPDTAQTFAVVLALMGQEANFTGLESLRIKETDRIKALQVELAKINWGLESDDDIHFHLKPIGTGIKENPVIDTYEDHRMAMSFALLGLKMEIDIIEPDVVGKSFPDYWKILGQLGFSYQNE